MQKTISFLFYFLLGLGSAFAQYMPRLPIDTAGERWVDSVFHSLTPEQKIGQLFMLSEFSDSNQSLAIENECLIKEYGIGGYCFFKGGPLRQAILCNKLQSFSKIPMLISMDAEWGLAMRLDSTISYPKQMALGAAANEKHCYILGQQMAEQCKRLGVHLSFSPVADVNNNPLNPVIGDRSFGEDKIKVSKRAVQYMRGLQDGHVLACAKHFPGHGNTESDSHLDLPIIHQPLSEIDTVELYPFAQLFANGVGSVMAAHLYIPSIDSTPNLATSLSEKAVTELLQKKMNFNGLIITDGLAMKGVAKFFTPHELALKALQAGNDILLCAEDAPQSITYILESIKKGKLNRADIDNRVKKILATKYWVGLGNYRAIDTTNLYNDLNKPEYYEERQLMAQDAICLVHLQNKLLPLKSEQDIVAVSIGTGQQTRFQEMLNLYKPMKIIAIDKYQGKEYFDSILHILKKADIVIASVQNTSRFLNRQFGLTSNEINFVNALPRNKTLLVHFGNVYALDSFNNFKNIINANEDWVHYQEATAQLMAGSIFREQQATLPVSASKEYSYNMGEGFPFLRSPYHDLNTSAAKLLEHKVDSIIQGAIAAHATPGCQVLVSHQGRLVLHKAYGTHTYTDSSLVKLNELYDIASVTKIMSTTLAIMKLVENGDIKLEEKLSTYLKDLRKTNKKDMLIKDVLTHRAGLQEWIPFYQYTLMDKQPSPYIYMNRKYENYTIQVADSLWMNEKYIDTLWYTIYKSSLVEPGKYAYSDIGFILLQKLIEKVSGKKLDDYMNRNFYGPMGLVTTTYNPLQKFERSKIIATEYDSSFRQQLVHGYVHDPAAAMMGGVAGHAGIFSNAFDIYQLMQMLMSNGSYQGKKYLNPETVSLFNSVYYLGLRRGLGFDKPETNSDKASPCTKYASPQTFGHQGFTGTCTWADPTNGIIIVFLSNRVNPDAANTKLSKMNVRTAVQDAAYEVLVK